MVYICCGWVLRSLGWLLGPEMGDGAPLPGSPCGLDFDAAADIVEADASDGSLGGEFEAAAAIVEAQPEPKRAPGLGFARRSAASTAFARKCKALQKSEGQRADLAARLRDLRQRRLLGTIATNTVLRIRFVFWVMAQTLLSSWGVVVDTLG